MSEFSEIVGRLKAEDRTVLIASHDPLVFDAPRIDTLVEMRDGGGVAGRSCR